MISPKFFNPEASRGPVFKYIVDVRVVVDDDIVVGVGVVAADAGEHKTGFEIEKMDFFEIGR